MKMKKVGDCLEISLIPMEKDKRACTVIGLKKETSDQEQFR